MRELRPDEKPLYQGPVRLFEGEGNGNPYRILTAFLIAQIVPAQEKQ